MSTLRGLADILAGASLLVFLAGCAQSSDYTPRVAGGDQARGRVALLRYECGACHVISGIRPATGHTGPPLDEYSAQPYIAGKFPNEPETLVRWILDAPAMAPFTAMPAVPMSERDARDIAAYLYEST